MGVAFTGLPGLSPFAFTTPGSDIVGVVKAYTTRVGLGPFPTELCAESPREYNRRDTAYGEQLQTVGRELASLQVGEDAVDGSTLSSSSTLPR